MVVTGVVAVLLLLLLLLLLLWQVRKVLRATHRRQRCCERGLRGSGWNKPPQLSGTRAYTSHGTDRGGETLHHGGESNAGSWIPRRESLGLTSWHHANPHVNSRKYSSQFTKVHIEFVRCGTSR